MKKFLVFINVIFIIASSMLFVATNNVSNNIGGSNQHVVQTEDLKDVYPLCDFISEDYVYEDELLFSSFYMGNFDIPTATIDLSLSNYRTGDILKKGQVINEYVIPYDLIIVEIYDDHIVVNNLDETKVHLDFLPSFKIESDSNISINIRNPRTSFNLFDCDFHFDSTIGKYSVEMKVDNDGKYINHETVIVDVNYIKHIDGLFVVNSYIYHDQLGDYVYKVIDIKGKDFYKKVYITVLENQGDFTKIEGDINGNNIIVKI